LPLVVAVTAVGPLKPVRLAASAIAWSTMRGRKRVAEETLFARLDRLDNRIQSLRWVIRMMAKVLGVDWAEVTSRAQQEMEADERKREADARSREAPDA
jgi:hypothetical protein